MKVLSLTQPWATLMAIGAKRYETRSWSTPHRGPLAIAASKAFPVECRELCEDAPFREVLGAAGYTSWRQLPTGVIVCVVDVVDVIRTESIDLVGYQAEQLAPQAEYEYDFGNYADGRFAWLTRNVRRLERPIAAKGRLGLWTYDDAAIAAALEGSP